MNPITRNFTLSFLTLLLLNCLYVREAEPAEDAADDATSIEEAFKLYRAALLAQNGEQAAEQVSASTFALYQEFRDHAIKSDRQTVEQLPISSRMTVLLMRHRMDPAKLRAMDGRAVFIFAVTNKWIGKNSVNKLQVTADQVDVKEGAITAEAFPQGRNAKARMSFVKEEGKGRVDLVPLMAVADEALQDSAKLLRIDENALLFNLIQMVSGRKVEDRVWEPIGGD